MPFDLTQINSEGCEKFACSKNLSWGKGIAAVYKFMK